MLLKPKYYNHSKAQKGRVSTIVKNTQSLRFGNYGIIAKQPSRINNTQLAATIQAIKRFVKKEIYIRIFPSIPVTCKPAEVRMGNGKGSIYTWVSRVRSGAILLEYNASNKQLATLAYRLAHSKLPIKTALISK